MNAMTHKGYAARVEVDAEDRIFVGRVIGVTGGVKMQKSGGFKMLFCGGEYSAAPDVFFSVRQNTVNGDLKLFQSWRFENVSLLWECLLQMDS